MSRLFLLLLRPRAPTEDLKDKDPVEVHDVNYRECLQVSEQIIDEIREATRDMRLWICLKQFSREYGQ